MRHAPVTQRAGTSTVQRWPMFRQISGPLRLTTMLAMPILTGMPSASPALGEFELLVLMAVLRGERPNGSRVRDELEAHTSRRIARGAVYVTLDRLEQKGLLTSDLKAETGRARPTRVYRVSPPGVRAVRQSIGDFARLRKGIERWLPIEDGL
jgi:PadR family transcriptional regulator PadR